VTVTHIPHLHPYVAAVDPSATGSADPWVVDDLIGGTVHVHFGFEHLAPSELGEWIDELQRRGRRLVHTVHDIDNPHLVDQAAHWGRTELLVRRSDCVVTLTESAADEIERRWGRRPVVIPHPPLTHRRMPTVETTEPLRGLVWLGTLRPNIDRDLVSMIADRSDGDFDVVARSDSWVRADASLRRSLAEADLRGRIDLRVVDRPSDHGLEALIAAAGVVVLPYAWGTHSGIVELATDLGVVTVTTRTGCRGDQGAMTVDAPDVLAAARAVMHDGRRAHRTPASSTEVVRSEHAHIYRSLARGPLIGAER